VSIQLLVADDDCDAKAAALSHHIYPGYASCNDDQYYDLSTSSCITLTACVVGTEFQTVAPTEFSDRVCSAATNCTLGATFRNVPLTATSDRVCGGNVSATCPRGMWATAATLTSDRGTCKDCTTSCPSGQTQATPCTAHSDLQCVSPSSNDGKPSAGADVGKPSAGADVGITFAVLIALALLAYFAVNYGECTHPHPRD